MSDDAAQRAAKTAARDERKVKFMTPQQRDEHRREQQQQRKMERYRDRAKADTARHHPSMVDLIERYESESVPFANRDDDKSDEIVGRGDAQDDDDDDDDDVATVATSSSSSKKRKDTTSGDHNDDDSDDHDNDANATNDDSAALPTYVDRVAFERYRASKAADIDREIDKLRRSLNPNTRYYDAQVKYVEKRQRQLEAQVRADFIVQQRDAKLHKRQKIRWSHNKRNKRGQPVMRTMIDDVLHRLERNGATAVVAPHQIKKKAQHTAQSTNAARRGPRRGPRSLKSAVHQ